MNEGKKKVGVGILRRRVDKEFKNIYIFFFVQTKHA
jgi:hypothetical protein